MSKKGMTNVAMLTLCVGGKEYPCRVTMGAMIRFKRATGYDVSKLDTSNLEDMIRFIWCCVSSACAVDKVEFSMDFLEFADQLDPDTLASFYDGMNNSVDAEKKRAAETSV